MQVDHSETLTLVIHGTYAADESWWRLADDENGGDTFADRLEAALQARGLQHTVWKPALSHGFGYDAFSWSGINRDRDRRAGARKLATALEDLAGRLHASEQRPLRVNLVAHSHGGNVALEAVRHFSSRIRLGRIVMMGTPLITRRPCMRIGRLMLANLMAMLLVSWTFLIPGVLVVCGPRLTVGGRVLCGDLAGSELLWVTALWVPMMLGYGLLFSFTAWLVDLIWRVVWLLCTFGWAPRPAYGPRTSDLVHACGGLPMVLISCDDDEAALLLQLGAAPRDLYLQHVKSRFGAVARAAEYVAVRPIIVGLLLRASETVLERLVLGFGWLRVLFFDYEMADLSGDKAYPENALHCIDMSGQLSLPTSAQEAHADARAAATRHESLVSLPVGQSSKALPFLNKHTARLLENLRSVREHLVSQVKLRHSLYYESSAVIERIAEEIVRAGTSAEAGSRVTQSP